MKNRMKFQFNHLSRFEIVRLLCFILIIGMIFGVIGFFYVFCMIHVQNEEIKNYFYEVAEQEAKYIKTQIDNDFSNIKNSALVLGKTMWDLGLEETTESLSELNANTHFQSMSVVLPDGRVWSTRADSERMIKKEHYMDEQFVKSLMESKHYFKQESRKEGEEKFSNYYSVPITKDDLCIGVLIVEPNTEVFRTITDNYTFDGEGFTHIIRSDGTIVMRSNHLNSKIGPENLFASSVVHMTENEQQLMKDNMAQQKKAVVRLTIDHTKEWVTYVPVGENDWYIFCVVPDTAVNQRFNSFVLVTICSVMVIILFFIVILLYNRGLHRRYREDLWHLAYFDRLTGAFNQYRFEMLLQDKMEQRGGDDIVAVMGISGFKSFNNLFGTQMGDELLKHMARVLHGNMRENEFFGRITADRFYLYLIGAEETIKGRLEKIIEEIKGFMDHANKRYRLVLNCGLYQICAGDYDLDIKFIIDRADIARKTIKPHYLDRIVFFQPEMQEIANTKKEMESTVQSAIENNEFAVWLQPQFDIQSQKMVGAEALVRWNHSRYGLLPPDRFIPELEENGFAVRLDNYVLDVVCCKLREWEGNPWVPAQISVNQTRLHIYEPQYVDELNEILKKWEINPKRICLEVTESVVQENLDDMRLIAEKLQQLGYLISMDDFGSGYSSLNVLTKMPVDELKLDRQFFQDIDDIRSRKIISNVLRMANDLQIRTVAEGIEEEKQVRFLKKEGCDIIQGYYFAKPMPLDDFEIFMKRGSRVKNG